MGKSISSPLYELKISNPNSFANFSDVKVHEAAAKDFMDYVGEQMQGFMIKGKDAKALVEKAKKDLIAKKVEQPVLRAGISGSDLIFLITDQKSSTKYEQSCILFSDYVNVREKHKTKHAMVVNLQKGDTVIDSSSDRMAKAKNTTTVEGKDAEFKGISGTQPIIFLAHGRESKTNASSGIEYASHFAGKTPDEIVSYLLDNSDEKKRLSKDYAGTIYLDGCFTAQSGAMDNYTQQVWNKLKGRGLKNVRVKGNIGAAATMDDGSEVNTITSAKKKAATLLEQANTSLANQRKLIDDRISEIEKEKYNTPKTKSGLNKDPEVIKLREKRTGLLKVVQERYDSELKKIPGYNVKDFVGQFGLELIK